MASMASSSTKRPNSAVHDKVREFLNKRGARSLKRIAKLFKAYDSDEADRSLSFKEMQQGLKGFGMDLNHSEMEILFRSFDMDCSGGINLDEFITALRPPMNAARRAIVDKAFDKLDKTGDGQITIEDIEHTYDVTKHPKYLSGEWTKNQVLCEFLEQFQVSGTKDDIITRQEFYDYYAMIGASIDRDVYFDYMVRNAWKL